ncbi:hypothetical protein B0H16DRAFT_1542853 [Mycena metata]|uniref:Uncharacterized protein n=1 Tax=Mycena metata TaxID=1033252 RepID=A0AAD7NCK8_9AGAR|nr:hypothetical protein B0H16DRAFT_1542853 [Mycena metata]
MTQETESHSTQPLKSVKLQMSSSIATPKTSRRATWAPFASRHGSKSIEMLSEPSIPTPPATSRPSRAASKWSPLTPSEAHALIQSELHPGRAPPFVLSEERRNMPRSEINRLSRKVAQENTLRRTHHVVREVGPVTHDERILRTFRRKSYSGPTNEYDQASMPLW